MRDGRAITVSSFLSVCVRVCVCVWSHCGRYTVNCNLIKRATHKGNGRDRDAQKNITRFARRRQGKCEYRVAGRGAGRRERALPASLNELLRQRGEWQSSGDFKCIFMLVFMSSARNCPTLKYLVNLHCSPSPPPLRVLETKRLWVINKRLTVNTKKRKLACYMRASNERHELQKVARLIELMKGWEHN